MLTRLQIDRIEPFADGMAFGTVGSYVRLVGTAYGELDPQHPRNAVIVNIDKAPCNAAAMSSMIRMSTSCGPQT